MNYSVVSDNESNQGVTFSNYGDTSWNPGTDGTGNLADSAGYSSATGSDPTAWDLTLGAGSPLVDAGSPDILDADGSASDIGAYGGPNSW
ncbi:MAG: hypothetical protein GY913_19350 [Proteobacteria bacterium]|nr:hypothetical protein [Pseudomonadota bacterium]MCP4919067.1 hypothetical protein [Pseudomonadota bacterium]